MKIKTYSKEPKNILEFIYLNDKKIRLRLYKSHSEGPFLHYEENEIEIKKIDSTINDINYYLTLLNTLKAPKDDHLEQLQKNCQILYLDLLSQKIKQSLQEISYNESLKLIIDEKLLYIPWELLFDGEKFLFEQFNIGRQIATEHENNNKFINSTSINFQKSPLKMLVLTDPTEDLAEAYNEGKLIFEEFCKEKTIHIEHHSSDNACLDYVKKNFPQYDIVHYAGHVEYDPTQPNKSGWALSDGILTIKDIENMCGTKIQMPSLIFCNACQSGFINKYSEKDSIYDSRFLNTQLATKFMRAGVKHYIGTFTMISDQYAMYMGIEFYRQLFHHGNSIGDSLKKAKEIIRKKYGTKCYSWINYVVYGEQDDYMAGEKVEKLLEKQPIKRSQTGAELSETLARVRDQINREKGIKSLPSFFSRNNKRFWLTAGILLFIIVIVWAIHLKIPKENGESDPPVVTRNPQEIEPNNTIPPPPEPKEPIDIITSVIPPKPEKSSNEGEGKKIEKRPLKKQSPSVVVLINEKTFNKLGWNWSTQGAILTEGKLNNILKENGFSVINAAVLKGEQGIFNGNMEQLLIKAKNAGIQIMLYGQLQIQDEGTVFNSQLRSFAGNLSLQAIQTDTMEVVSSSDTQTKEAGNSIIAAKNNIYNRLINSIGDEWLAELLNNTIDKYGQSEKNEKQN